MVPDRGCRGLPPARRIAGIRPLFIDSGGARLAGLGHPAFLAGVCLPAIYACLIQLYRRRPARRPALLLANVLILVLTGARAPFAYAVAVTGLSLITIRSSVFAARDRLLLLLAAPRCCRCWRCWRATWTRSGCSTSS